MLASSSATASFPSVPVEVREAMADPHNVGQSARGGTLYVAVAENGMVVRLAYPLSGIGETMHVLRRDLLLASLFAIGLATLLAAFFAHRAARRLGRIVTFAGRISAGDFTARIEEGNLDEISAVAHALDSTAARLEASFHALESKQRELAALLDSMQEAVIAVDGGGRISWSNAVMQRIAPGAVRQGQALVHAVRDPEVLACVEAALENRELRSGKATSVVQARIFEVNAAPTPGGGAVAVLHDVTEIERAEKTRRDFVANVSHELRTPLTLERTLLEVALADPDASAATLRSVCAQVLSSGRHQELLIDALLVLSRSQRGLERRERVDLGAVAARTLADTDARGLRVERSLALAQTDGDPRLIERLAGNLIANAVQHNRPGGRIDVATRTEGERAILAVANTGPAIADEDLKRLFEPFERLDGARMSGGDGLGLGLSIVHAIAEAHGATITTGLPEGGGLAIEVGFAASEHGSIRERATRESDVGEDSEDSPALTAARRGRVAAQSRHE
jgi:two-component system phosphate regulon sensor histidine kinase PhoR